jgi:hypothetical protein
MPLGMAIIPVAAGTEAGRAINTGVTDAANATMDAVQTITNGEGTGHNKEAPLRCIRTGDNCTDYQRLLLSESLSCLTWHRA